MTKNRLFLNKVTSGIMWSYAEKILAHGITLLVSIILARLLEPEHYGTIAIVQIFISICDTLVIGGFGNALVQKKEVSDIDFNSVCWLSIGVAVILYGILFITAPAIAYFYNDMQLSMVMQVMGIRFIFIALNSVQHAYIQRKMAFKKFFFSTLGGTIFSAFLGIGMALKGYGVWALVAQYMSNTIIDTIVLFVIIEWKPRLEVSRKSISSLWKFGSKMLVSTLVFTVKDNIRSLIIGKNFSSSELAYYNQGKKYPALIVTDIVDSLGKVLFPLFSKEQESLGKVKELMRRSISMCSYILSPVIIGLIAIADTFVIVVLTEKWLPCVPYIRILCLVYLTRSLSSIFQKGLLAIGKSEVNLFHEFVTSVTTIILLVIAAFIFKNVELIAWSYVIVMFIGVMIFAHCVRINFNYKYIEMIMDYMPSLIISIVMGVVVWLVGKCQVVPVIKLLLQILIGGLVYFVLSAFRRDRNLEHIIRFVMRR